ncbi:glycerol-3-phosphate 1-O-acyltransferase PlsY [Phenylobacterium sp.]|uniref:glycerol-3-phosphate 1-O-acyltransferase PlsY n=1 Tax=Phenylobacterium sp. TaxID=1871053 RepID=UPI0027311076|nr:glycerol-3-phosphate 1-O-acyltransferase PlsY [Phenylobacterium sp.]MDP1874001.1 glycerol-3-phosphate 1-O-acyltransferase PlsY [Phenylobacterium sp.]MDP3488822.1 glycerol-3-phosphate 1-O-acyltransferase PlsY [Phenylobacterium sp.]
MPTDQLSPMLIAVALIGGYFLGSIPFGVIATRLGGAGDVRSIGSGNIGATNVLRTGRKDLALLTLLGDGGKGAIAVFIAWSLTRNAPQGVQATLTSLAGGAAFIGHIFPVWLGFKGGKGVATFFGTLLAAAWPVGLLAGATWILMALVFRMSSLAALTAAVLAPIYVFLTDRPYPVAVLAVVMAVLIFVRHKDNIGRLLKGQEPRIGGDKAPPPADAA